MATTEEKRKACENVKQQFRLFTKKIIGLNNAPFQNELDDVLSDSLNKKICIAFARDHGKSTHISVAYPLWEIARNHNLRILLISATSGVAKGFMTEIMGHIEKNQKYQAWAQTIDPLNKGVIPKQKGLSKATEKWTNESIIIEREDLNLKDPTINAVGCFGSILSKRADLIIVDDLVNQINSMTEQQRLKVIDWLYTTILPVLIPGGRFVYLGNTWHMDDLVARLLKDPQFDYKKKRAAIIKESDYPELWQQWSAIILDESLTIQEKRKKSEDFYQEHKALMDSGVEVLWPARYTYKELYLKRISNSYAFARMYQCDPSDRPNQKIKDEWIEEALKKGKGLRLQKEPHAGINISISCSGLDLAISEKESSDDTVLLTLDKIRFGNGELKEGDYVIRNIIRGKFSPNTVKLMVENHSKEDPPPHGIRVETVGYQEAIKRDLEDRGIKVTGYHTGGEKHNPDSGVNSIALLLENGKLVLPFDHSDPNTIKLISQLANEMRSYPDGHTGDALMALWFALSEIRDRTSNSLVVPSSFMKPKETPDISKPEIRQAEEKKADLAMSLEKEHERREFVRMMRR